MKKKLTNLEIITIEYFMAKAFLIGGTFNAIVKFLKQDSWIAPLLGLLPAFIFIFILDYISKYKENLNFSEKLIDLFKKKLGNIIIILTSIFALGLCILNLRNLANFIQSQFLNKTPILVIVIAFIIAIYYILTKGINTISRTGVILFYIASILFIFCLIGLFPNLDISNLKPSFVSNTTNYLKSLNIFFSFNILPLLTILTIPKNDIKKPKFKKNLLIAYSLATISIFFIIFTTITMFGYELTLLFEYPEFSVLKYVSIIGINSRIESILVMQLIFDIFMSIIFVIYFIAQNLKTLFNLNNDNKNINIIYLIICIICAISSSYLTKINTLIDQLLINKIPIIVTTFSILLIIIICIKIKTNKKKNTL